MSRGRFVAAFDQACVVLLGVLVVLSMLGGLAVAIILIVRALSLW